MMLILGEWLAGFNDGFRVVEYITLRAIFAALTSLIFCLLCGPLMIHWLMRASIGQSVREDGPSSHLSKAGTPTMGGAMILVAVGLSVLLWSDLTVRHVWVVLFITTAFGVIGWVDDYRKVLMNNSAGLSARAKYLWQSVAALAAAIFIFLSARSVAEVSLLVPFVKDVSIYLGLSLIHI